MGRMATYRRLQLLVAAVLLVATLLGAGGAEAARSLPAPAPLPEPTSFSAAELLSPAADNSASHPFRLVIPELFSYLTSFCSVSMTHRTTCTMRTADFRGTPEKHYRLFLSSRPDLLPTEGFVIWKLASGVFDKSGGNNVWISSELAGDLHRPTFQGLWTDPVTGLSYARNRWYDARTASWLSTDPLGAVDSQNLYAFVGHSPHMGTDPLGLYKGVTDEEHAEILAWTRALKELQQRAALEAIKQEALWFLGDTLDGSADETDLRNSLWQYLYDNRIGASNTERYSIMNYILGPANTAPLNSFVYVTGEHVGRYAENIEGTAIFYLEFAAGLPAVELSAPLTRVAGRFLARSALGRTIRGVSSEAVRATGSGGFRVQTGLRGGGPASGRGASRARPAWLDDVERGTNFNKVHQFDYPYRELYLDKPGGGYVRLDAYDDLAGEIVSRKLTQLGAVQEGTGIGYLRELAAKYPAGARVANVPSSGPLAGQFIQGQQILEVPIQTGPIPQAVLSEARRLHIVIRDVTGTVYR